jgi:hypothetical protein
LFLFLFVSVSMDVTCLNVRATSKPLRAQFFKLVSSLGLRCFATGGTQCWQLEAS